MPSFDHSDRNRRRRALLQSLAAACALGAVGTARARTASDDDDDRDRADGDGREIRIVAQTGPSTRFAPTALVVEHDGESFRADLPLRAVARRADRIDLAAAPLVGVLFDRPATADIEPAQRVGGLFRRGDVLVAVLDPGTGGGWSGRAVTLVTRTPLGRSVVSIELRPSFAPTPPLGAGGERIGDVYLALGGEGGLVLAPPRAWLTGFDLQSPARP